METSVEMEQLRSAWRSLDRRLELGHRLQFDALRDRKVRSARGSLFPVIVGQAGLMAFGLAMVVFGVNAWASEGRSAPVIASAVVLHIYGVFIMAVAGATLGKALAIDFTAPVLVIQRRLIALEGWYIRFGLAVALPWFVLWVPAMICLPKVDMVNSTWVALNLAIGACGIAALVLLRAYGRRSGNEHWLRWLDESAGRRALARARAHIGELDQFEQDRD